MILALIFTLFALIAVIIMINIKVESLIRFKKYLIASSLVYFSGTLLILLIDIIKGPIAFPFILICDLLVTFVYVMSVLTMARISSQIKEIRKEIDEKNNKTNN